MGDHAESTESHATLEFCLLYYFLPTDYRHYGSDEKYASQALFRLVYFLAETATIKPIQKRSWDDRFERKVLVNNLQL